MAVYLGPISINSKTIDYTYAAAAPMTSTGRPTPRVYTKAMKPAIKVVITVSFVVVAVRAMSSHNGPTRSSKPATRTAKSRRMRLPTMSSRSVSALIRVDQNLTILVDRLIILRHLCRKFTLTAHCGHLERSGPACEESEWVMALRAISTP